MSINNISFMKNIFKNKELYYLTFLQTSLIHDILGNKWILIYTSFALRAMSSHGPTYPSIQVSLDYTL